MQIRPYVPADSPQLEQLLRHIWGNEPHDLNYYRFGPDSTPDGPRFLRTLVAEEQGRPVAFGTVWTNPFHPHALYLCINVHPAWRRQGIGTRLLEALDGLNGGRLPLQGCTWQTSVAGCRFLKKHGFFEARRTYEPALHVADVDLDSFRLFEERCLDHGYRLCSLTELAQEPAHEERLAALLAETYTATHGVNPPRLMDLAGWIERLQVDPPDEAGSFVALHGEQYAAMSLAHRDGPDTLALSWSGVTQGHSQHERDLILSLTIRQIGQAARQGIGVLQSELDSTSPWAMMQLGALPFRPAPCWLTFYRPHRS